MKELLKRKNIKLIIALFFVIIFTIGIVLLISKSGKDVFDDVENISSDANDELSIGERKYLEFLWMVDGAFNYERYNHEDFVVNGKKLESHSNFSCEYDSLKKTCRGINFEENYNKLFAKNVKLDNVYGDGLVGKWYEKMDNDYFFTNINNCDAGRMNTRQTLNVVSSSDKKMTYKAIFEEELKSGVFKGHHRFENDFVLVYENGDWKVSEAYFHDPCYMDYYIK